MPGPPKVPTALRKARGNRGHEIFSAFEPQPPATTADPPADLTGEARALWERLAPELVKLGTLTVIDRDEFAKGCRLEAEGWHNFPVDTDLGLRCLKQASTIFGRFGVGASDRTKIHVQPPKPASKWQSLAS